MLSIREIKGYEVHDPERVNSKLDAAKKWVRADNNLTDFGMWDFLVCRDLEELESCMGSLMGRNVDPTPQLPGFALRA